MFKVVKINTGDTIGINNIFFAAILSVIRVSFLDVKYFLVLIMRSLS